MKPFLNLIILMSIVFSIQAESAFASRFQLHVSRAESGEDGLYFHISPPPAQVNCDHDSFFVSYEDIKNDPELKMEDLILRILELLYNLIPEDYQLKMLISTSPIHLFSIVGTDSRPKVPASFELIEIVPPSTWRLTGEAALSSDHDGSLNKPIEPIQGGDGQLRQDEHSRRPGGRKLLLTKVAVYTAAIGLVGGGVVLGLRRLANQTRPQSHLPELWRDEKSTRRHRVGEELLLSIKPGFAIPSL